MPHVGIALDHPANAQVLARLAYRKPVDREKLIASLEKHLATRHDDRMAQALEQLKRGEEQPAPERPPSRSPEGQNRMELGTHPDLVDHLWSIGAALPENCCWTSYRQPVLAHAQSGIIFGLAIGTLGYALRLPPDLAEEARTAGDAQTANFRDLDGETVLHLDEFGPDWFFGRFDRQEDLRRAKAAYAYFGNMNPAGAPPGPG